MASANFNIFLFHFHMVQRTKAVGSEPVGEYISELDCHGRQVECPHWPPHSRSSALTSTREGDLFRQVENEIPYSS